MFVPKTRDMLGIHQSKFDIAEDMLKQGHSALATFKKTRCFQTPDGIMKMEIPDNKAKFGTPMRSHARIKAQLQELVERCRKGEIELEEAKPIHSELMTQLRHEEWRIDNEEPGTLSFYLQHEKLFEAYPNVRKLPVRLFSANDSGVGGYTTHYRSQYSYDRAIHINREHINNSEIFDSYLLHELQHIIQTDNGWSVGGSPDQFVPESINDTPIPQYEWAIKEFEDLNILDIKKRALESAKKLPKGHWADLRLEIAQWALTPEEKKIISNYTLCIKEGQDSRTRYRELLGEIEAYAVMERREKTDEELLKSLPLMDQKEYLKNMIIGDNFLIENKFLTTLTSAAVRELSPDNAESLTA
ncbi:hypothetical protein [Vibrio owensii]|uniref:hypothetical protein n=1 Tax=Vibrio harveyi group TaxID=717610 RepID=UPI003CC5BEB1